MRFIPSGAAFLGAFWGAFWPVVPACFACLPGCLPSCLPGCLQNCCLPGYYLCSTGRLQNCELPDLVPTKRKRQKHIAKILLDLIIAGTLAEFPSKNPFRRATHAGTKHRIRLRTEILGGQDIFRRSVFPVRALSGEPHLPVQQTLYQTSHPRPHRVACLGFANSRHWGVDLAKFRSLLHMETLHPSINLAFVTSRGNERSISENDSS